jgi:phosphoribosylanthranilate isomerase
VKVKICGITNKEDAGVAADAGADALGFIFASSSPRYLAPERAADIITALPPFVTAVGVFVNATRDHICDVIEKTGVRCIQLHGEERPEDCEGYSIAVYKAFGVDSGFDVRRLAEYATPAFLLDARVNGRSGGSGRTFDWDVAVAAKPFGRIILGGGLTPANVEGAIRHVRPYAIDVNSGVESAPGRKDPAKLRRLFDVLQTIESQRT